MWRSVTRCLIFAFVALAAPALFAQQELIGALDHPDPGVTHSGVIFFKGWVLNPQQTTDIQVYVDDQFIASANRGLPRIDVIEAYPNWPGVQNIAPGFQVGVLASRLSNGTHTVEVRVRSSNNTITPLGRRTIDVDNTINQAPFGNLDTPDLAAAYNASGSFPVQGWALDTDGVAAVDVYVDGGILQSAVYGDARPDVANTYPDFPAALYSSFIANIDSTRLVDGIHLLEVKATDRQGLSRLIGTRQIQVFNEEGNLKPFGYIDEPKRDAVLYGTQCAQVPLVSPAVNPQSHITPVRGWALDLGTRNDTGRVAYVELMIDGVRWYSTDDCSYSNIFQTFTNCYGLTRYDVQRYYPNYPDVPRAGFVFTMDVGALLAMGVRPGNHILKVRVGDQQQTFVELPGPAGMPVFFQCAENTLASANGFIDVPAPFDYMKGTVVFQGWAATEFAFVKDVEIIIDGFVVGLAQHGFPRPDVQEQNPFLRNAQNSGWRFTYDTTKLRNERHRLTVRVVDTQGKKTEIGSVDFYTQNNNPAP
jgi:Bacterial Ig domain